MRTLTVKLILEGKGIDPLTCDELRDHLIMCLGKGIAADGFTLTIEADSYDPPEKQTTIFDLLGDK